MEQIYHDPSHYAAFGGRALLRKATGKSEKKVHAFLEKNKVYRKFKKNKTNFQRASVFVQGLGYMFQADLFSINAIASKNSNYRYILLVVDCFTRRITVRALKRKTADATAQAMDEIFAEIQQRGHLAPRALIGSDLGTELWNEAIDRVYAKYNISHFALKKPHKAQLAEISGRYLMDRIHKWRYQTGSDRWIDQLNAFVSAKNNRPIKRLGGLAPAQITFENSDRVYESLLEHRASSDEKPLADGTKVQLAIDRLPFAKSYAGYYTDQYYEITGRNSYNGINRYKVKDVADDMPISGTYYAQELLPLLDENSRTRVA